MITWLYHLIHCVTICNNLNINCHKISQCYIIYIKKWISVHNGSIHILSISNFMGLRRLLTLKKKWPWLTSNRHIIHNSTKIVKLIYFDFMALDKSDHGWHYYYYYLFLSIPILPNKNQILYDLKYFKHKKKFLLNNLFNTSGYAPRGL